MQTRVKDPESVANSAAAVSPQIFFCAIVAIVLATIAAYANSFSGPFVFDDQEAILENETLRSLGTALSPPKNSGVTVSGRPVVNFTLAVNRMLGGTDPRGYHLGNLLIHLGAALALFGGVRRSFLQPKLRSSFGEAALPLACTVAILWAVHPLQTESITYIVQRAEALVGLFYLLTLYFSIRSLDAPPSPAWPVLAWTACLLGMASKEVMVSAPLLVVLYDRAFVFPSFREAWLKRRNLYLALSSTWILLGWLVTESRGRGATTGFESGVAWPDYALTQFRALALYLRLAVWPSPLVFDYGTGVAKTFGEVAPYALLTLALVAGTLLAWRRSPVLGFLGTFVFAVLAPTTSILPVATQTMAEHRMYLPLAALIALAVGFLYRVFGLKSLFIWGLWACFLGALTARRNDDYRTEIGLWNDTVQKIPNENARAHFNLGMLLNRAQRREEAIEHYQAAVRIKPTYFEAQTNLGSSLVQNGHAGEAIEPLTAAIRLRPELAESYANLGGAFLSTGRLLEAKNAYEQALRLKPNDGDVRVSLGRVFAGLRQFPEALRQWEEALKINPRNENAHTRLGITLCQLGRPSEGISHFSSVVQLKPNDVEAENNLGNALLQLGRADQAILHYELAVKIAPNSFEAFYNLGNAFSQSSKWPEAVESYQSALGLRPESADAHINRGNALVQMSRIAEGIRDYEEAARIEPANTQIRELIARLRVHTLSIPLQK